MCEPFKAIITEPICGLLEMTTTRSEKETDYTERTTYPSEKCKSLFEKY